MQPLISDDTPLSKRVNPPISTSASGLDTIPRLVSLPHALADTVSLHEDGACRHKQQGSLPHHQRDSIRARFTDGTAAGTLPATKEQTCQPTFSHVGLHQSFFSQFPDRQALNNVKETSLPHVPSCPGPYLLPDKQALPRPEPSLAFSKQYPMEAHWYNTVIKQGKPIYRGARLPITHLPLNKWKAKLRGYQDWQLTAFMRYGWPMGYEGSEPPDLWQANHGSARRQPEHISHYINKEASLQALAGPFQEPPFQWLRVNPMMTREKKEPGNYRVVLDLSFPGCDSVNGHINKHLLEGAPYKLHLPTPLDLAELITQIGPGALLFKLDLA